MIDFLSPLALSSYLGTTACLSAIVLSIQRGYHHSIKLSENDSDDVLVKYDQHRDPKVPFADSNRIPRLIFGTFVLFLLSIYSLYIQVKKFDHQQDSVHLILAASFVLITWLYALTLTLISRKYQLPSQWGFILNAHLCLLYFVAFFITIHDTWTLITTKPNMSWLKALPILLRLILTMDLLYTTLTIGRGAPFIDDKGKPVNPIDVSSIWSYFTFSWVTPLIRLAYSKKKLSDDDLPTLTPIYRGRNLFYIFGEHRGSKLLYRIYRSNRVAIIAQVILAFVTSFLYYAPAYFINRILNLIQDIGSGKKDDHLLQHGIVIIAGLGLSIIIISLGVAQLWYFCGSYVQVRIKALLNIEIYRKTLRRMDTNSNSEENDEDKKQEDDAESKKKDDKDKEEKEDVSSSTGTIVNLMSTDSNRISEFSTWWFSVIAAPTELFIGIYFLYNLLGVSCFLGLLVMVVTLPANHYNAKLFAKSQDRLMEARDKRVNLMNEVLQGIRQIKFFAWENNWEKRVMEARKVELKHLKMGYLAELGFNFLWQGSPILVTIVSFYSFTKLEGKELTAPIAFTAITVFNELRFALNVLPEVFIEWLQALISIRRIEQYLGEPEVVEPPTVNINEPVVIGFKDATVGFKLPKTISSSDSDDRTATSDDSEGFILKDLNLEFPNEALSVICGQTGSGKTLMVLSLLGEAVVLEGQAFCPRTGVADVVSDDFKLDDHIAEEDWILDHAVAYVAQTAWLQNASIRDNILFGLPYNEKRYKDTLYACSLVKDLTILEDGDMTEIGEKGITLSGGQKARVALARAVYSRAKNILMDDVLSAVDAHTAKHIFTKCLMGPLMKNRTRILITHHVKLCLGGVSYLVHIQNGRVNLLGSPSDLRSSGKLETILEEEKNQGAADDEEEAIESTETNETEDATDDDINKKKKSPRVLVEEESRATGKVKLRLYGMYLKMVGNPFYWFLATVAILGTRVLDISESWWIKQWAQSYNTNIHDATHIHSFTSKSQPSFSYLTLPVMSPSSTDNFNIMGIADKDDHLNYYLGVYVLIAFANIIFSVSRFGIIYFGILRASRILYGQLLHRVLRAPLRFFDTTPIGRILNRFAKDIETIDSTIPNDLINFIIQWIIVLSSIIAVSFVLPAFVLPMIVIAVINVFVGIMFVSTSRELRRMDSVSRSPLFSHFTETIVGITTIRAFGATRRFLQEMITRTDVNSRPYYFVWTVNRWVSIRYGFTGAIVNVIACAIVLLSLDYLDAALAGFCLSYILLYSDQMFWAIRRYTSLEMSFNAIERVVEFMEMDQEANAITDYRPPPQWPTQGAIEVKDLEVRYAEDLPAVIHNLSFSVKPQEKIGIVGATGSGKSTLALSFFRFVEASKGSITIDNVDISRIGTEDLRSNLTIIPQDPVLFSGSLRSNMDPFDQFTDDEIFTALKRVHLIPTDDDALEISEEVQVNENVFKDLNSNVTEGGKNFSNGQRQLICLARALLKRSKVVLMDEATASVDFDTDKLIQKNISTEFSDSTILTIAHRLATIIDYDRIMVLHHGELLEFDSPMNLLNNSDSAFYKMCVKSGEFESLLAAASQKA